MTDGAKISHAELHGSSQKPSKTEIEETKSQKERNRNEESQAQESSSDEEEVIDLTKKIKVEDMKINAGKYRYQIFVPAVHDVDCKFISSEKLSIQFTSKDKSFLAEHSRGSNEYFCVNIKMAEDSIDKENIVVRGVRRKTFEVEVSYLRGKAPVPPPPCPAPSGRTSATLKLSTKSEKPVATVAPMTKAGYTGLINVGNTCFMASVIQCLSNIPALRDYFLSQDYEADINDENPLGTGGKMANAFYYLLTQLWSAKHKAVKPTQVKQVVGERAPQFQGYSQHDAQEFCAYILDLLHEDVNLIKSKPYVEAKEADGRPDKVVAEESWDIFSRRNKSKIVDLFYGQYKSNLRCPKCEKQSITFDPFVYLSVPLPRELRKLSVLFFFASPEKRPHRFEIQVSKKGGSVREIYLQVSKITDIPLADLRVLTSYKQRLHKTFSQTADLDDIDSTSEVIVSEVVENDENVVIGLSHRKELKKVSDPEKCQCCGVLHSEKPLKRCAKCRFVWYCSKECIKENYKYHKPNCEVSKEFIGNPLFISVPRRISRSTLHKLILDYAAFSIDYSWSIESLERQKNAASDYETPPSSPENELNEECQENGEALENDETNLNPHVPFRLLATTQHGTDSTDKQSAMTEEEDVYLLDDVNFLTAEWLNDKHRIAKKNEPYVPWLESVSSVSHEDIRCDRMSNYDDTVTLERCIELFSEAEILEEEDFWYCSCCKEHVAAQKQLSLWKLPKVLIFHLKRFNYHQTQSTLSTRSTLRRDKINKLVDYQVENLDMSPFVIDPKEACNGIPPNYELCGVVNHMGSMSFGHYTAYVKHPDKKEESKWRLADDSHVRDVRPASVVSDNGYLLFYKLKEPQNTDLKTRLQSYEEVKLEEQMEKMTFESLKETYEAKECEKLTEENEDANEDPQNS